MKPRQINKQDIEFLLALQFKMNTQDTVSQASPRYWSVIEKHREWGIESGYEHGHCITHCDGGEYHGGFEDVLKELVEQGYDILNYEESEDGEIRIGRTLITDLEDVIEYLQENDNYDFQISNYKDVERVVQDTMFLTLEACEKHIELNHYHYNQGRPYGQTAWRSPQVERLYDILENVVWEDSLNCEVEIDDK